MTRSIDVEALIDLLLQAHERHALASQLTVKDHGVLVHEVLAQIILRESTKIGSTCVLEISAFEGVDLLIAGHPTAIFPESCLGGCLQLLASHALELLSVLVTHTLRLGYALEVQSWRQLHSL